MSIYYSKYRHLDDREGHHIRSGELKHLCDIHFDEKKGRYVLSEPPEFVAWSGDDLIYIGKKLNELNMVAA